MLSQIKMLLFNVPKLFFYLFITWFLLINNFIYLFGFDTKRILLHLFHKILYKILENIESIGDMKMLLALK